MARGRRTLIGIVLIRQFNTAKQGGGCPGMRVVRDSGGGKQRVACVLCTQRLWRNRREVVVENHGVGPTEKKMVSVSWKTRNPNVKLLVLRSHIEW